MPWTGAQFSERHNHGLHGGIADHAARIANAILKSGGGEGVAIATANKWAQHHATGGGIARYDDGGGVGGITPPSATQSPIMQGIIERYSGLPTEKLQELAGTMGGSPQGQVIRQLLTRRLTQPNAPGNAPPQQPAQGPVAPQGAATAQQRRGGVTPHRDAGGMMSMSQADPSWARQDLSQMNRSSGVLNGATFGRADSIKTQAPGGAFVLPADVISGLGEGNALAGARVADEMFKTGPMGIPMPRGGSGGRGLPHAPAVAQAARGGHLAHGGATQKVMTPVMLSDGEYVISPEQIIAKFGNLKHGHKMLDAWVDHERKKHIKTLQRLPGTVKV